MTLAFSTGWMGPEPFGADRLLEVMQALNLCLNAGVLANALQTYIGAAGPGVSLVQHENQ